MAVHVETPTSLMQFGQTHETLSGPYDPQAYDGLPTLSEAGRRFDTIDGETLISTVFRELFVAHSMDRTFGLILLHRHFDLDPNEKLVEYRGTSVPWKMSKISKGLSAACWVVSADGIIRPYEFTYSSTGDESAGVDPAKPEQAVFLNAFRVLLSKYQAEGVFGLCRYPGDNFRGRVEITESRANINLMPEDHRFAHRGLVLLPSAVGIQVRLQMRVHK